MPIDPKQQDLVAEYRQHIDAGDSAGSRRIAGRDQIIPDFVAAVVDQMVEVNPPAAVLRCDTALLEDDAATS